MLRNIQFALFFTMISICFGNLAYAADTPSNAKDAIPDAMQHLVKAPDINFETLRDPFASYLATLALRSQRLLNAKQAKLANRKRGELEMFDLSSLSLVAIFKMGEKRVAMVQDSQGKGYTVSQGSYMGKHNGHIEKIDDDTVYLVEQVVNPAGDVVDQQVTLTLKEVNK